MKRVQLVAHLDGMARVRAALEPYDDVRAVGKVVDDLPLAFIAELGSHHNGRGHANRRLNIAARLMVLWMAERATPDGASRAPVRDPVWRPSTSRGNVLFAGGLCPAPPVRVGGGFHPVAGDRQDSHVCRGPGRSSERRDPARTHRPGGGTSRPPEVVVSVPHPLSPGGGDRGPG